MLKDLSKYGIDTKNLNNKKNKIKIKSMMGNGFLKSPEELKVILGWNSILKIFMAKIFSKLIDFKENIKKGSNYSKLVRIGKNYSLSQYKPKTTLRK